MNIYSEKKRIIFVITSLVGGGAEKVLMDIMNALDPSPYDMALVVFEKKGVYLPAVPDYVRIYDLHKNNRYDFPRLIIQMAILFRRLKPDTVVSLISYTNLVVVIARLLFIFKRRFNIVIGEHIHMSSSLKHVRLKYLKRFLYGIFYNFANACIVPSDGVREDLVYLFHMKANKIKVIHNPIDVSRINRLKDEPLNRLDIDPGKYILAAGRLVDQKGYAYLLRAYSLISSKVAEKLFILGEGEKRGDLIALAKELGVEKRVIFAGFETNPYKFMKNASLFVLSSIYESFALVIVEAMASGVAVIAADCPSGPAEIIASGVNGVLVPPADEKKLAKAMLELLMNPALRNTLIENGRKRADAFDMPNILPHYEALF